MPWTPLRDLGSKLSSMTWDPISGLFLTAFWVNLPSISTTPLNPSHLQLAICYTSTWRRPKTGSLRDTNRRDQACQTPENGGHLRKPTKIEEADENEEVDENWRKVEN